MLVILISASSLLLLFSQPKRSGNSSICRMYQWIDIVCFLMITLKQVVIFLVYNYSCYQFLCFFVSKVNHENFYAYSNWVFQHTGKLWTCKWAHDWVYLEVCNNFTHLSFLRQHSCSIYCNTQCKKQSKVTHCIQEISMCHPMRICMIQLLNRQFNEFQWSVTWMSFVFTYSQFNVFSGSLIECLDEPWHVGVCAAGSLTTTTLLSIPQWVIVEDWFRAARVSTRFTVVVSTNIWWSDSSRSLFTWTIIWTIKQCSIKRTTSICPDMYMWSVSICDGHSINISIINSEISVYVIWTEC